MLLISDAECDKAAAAMDVRVGHLSDPPYLPGLAHFCEHMCFLGTGKYPVENRHVCVPMRRAGATLWRHGSRRPALRAAPTATCSF